MLDFILDLIKEFIKYFLRRFIPFCVICFFVVSYYYFITKPGIEKELSNRGKQYDFDEITNHKLEDSDFDFDSNIGIRIYLDACKFKEYKGSLGNTSRKTYDFYSKNGKILFSVTDVGNNDIYIVEIDNKKHIYQKSGYDKYLDKEYIDRIEKSKKEEIDRSWKK